MSKILRKKIEALNRRGKCIDLFASYSDGDYCVDTFGDYQISHYHVLHSITKVITCATVMALAEDRLIPLETPLLTHLTAKPTDARYYQLTIEQFANMSTGMHWREIDSPTWQGSQLEQLMKAPDALTFILQQPLSDAAHFAYNTASSHALVYWAEAVAGVPFEQLVEAYLFRPLAIDDYKWQRDRAGRVYGGHGLSLRGVDFLKLMPLLSTGSYADVRVLSARIMDKWRHPVVRQSGRFSGYSYGLWHGAIKKTPFIGAYGRAGQRVFILPSQSACVGFLGDTHPEFGIHESLLKHLI